MPITTLQARTSKTAAFTGTTEVDISAKTGGRIRIRVHSLTAGKKARFSLQDSVDNFVASLAGPSFSLKGEVAQNAYKDFEVHTRDFPSLRFGVASAELRLSLTEIDAASTIVYEAWIEDET